MPGTGLRCGLISSPVSTSITPGSAAGPSVYRCFGRAHALASYEGTRHAACRGDDVRDEAPGTIQERLVFLATDRLADESWAVMTDGPPGAVIYRGGGRWHLLRGLCHGLDNAVVAGAPTQRRRHALADFVGDGARRCRSRSYATISIPGVQNPHCRPCISENSSCSRAIVPDCERPSMVSMLAPFTCTANMRQERSPGRRP